MNQLAANLRAAAERIEQLPAGLPVPDLTVTVKTVHARWRVVNEEQARQIMAALPDGWEAGGATYMYRYSGDDVLRMCFVDVDPAALLAEVQ